MFDCETDLKFCTVTVTARLAEAEEDEDLTPPLSEEVCLYCLQCNSYHQTSVI